MDATETRMIIKTLAQGVDPVSGEVFPPDSPYNDPKIIRALFHVVDLAWQPGRSKLSLEERRQRNLERGLPRNAGLPWSDQDRIDPGNADNGAHILQGVGMFDLDNDRNRLVGRIDVLLKLKAVAMGPGDAYSPDSFGWILAQAHHALRLFHRVDLRHDDARRADVQRFFDPHLLARRNPNQAGAAATSRLQKRLPGMRRRSPLNPTSSRRCPVAQSRWIMRAAVTAPARCASRPASRRFCRWLMMCRC